MTMDRHAVSVDLPRTAPIVVPPTDHDLTVIIPAFNEEKRLPWTLRELTGFLSQWGVNHHVLVADDGSTDRTATLDDAFGPRCSTTACCARRQGAAPVRTAMLRATGAWWPLPTPTSPSTFRHCNAVISGSTRAGARSSSVRRRPERIGRSGAAANVPPVGNPGVSPGGKVLDLAR